jgi:hypothetical protein
LSWLVRFATRPGPYLVWALVVAASLYGTYRSDPYVFAFTAMGLLWLTGLVALAGLAACLFSRRPRARQRAAILGALALAAAAIAKAFDTLSGFNWA